MGSRWAGACPSSRRAPSPTPATSTSSATSSATCWSTDMPGTFPSQGRISIAVAQFNETVTSRLLSGARACLKERGVADERIEVRWGAGAWELPLLAQSFADDEAFIAVCALGAVVRGETPHFDYVAGEC